MKFYKPKYFAAYEVVPPEIFQVYAEASFFFIRPEILKTADDLRAVFGRAIINDYQFGGSYKYRGFRPPLVHVGAFLSEHKRGNALDIVFENYDAEEVRQYILKRPEKFPAIKRIEGGVSWLHFDGLKTEAEGIYIFHK